MSSVAEFSPGVVESMWRRAFGSCERCGRSLVRAGRGWGWSAHHRQPRGMGGTSNSDLGKATNGLILCGHGTAGCHGWVESNRREAVLAGLIVPSGESPAVVPVWLRLFGRVLLLENGDVGNP